MKTIKKIVNLIVTQFRTHTVRSLLITIPAAALATAGILWASGIFEPAGRFAYLPDREYILAPAEKTEPQTLEELLHLTMSEPSLDTLLRNPSIAGELMKADKLTDVVDSRLALNNLRSLDQQLSERLGLEQGLPAYAHGAAIHTTGVLAVPAQALEQQKEIILKLKDVTGRLLAPKEYGELELIPSTMNMKGIWQTPNEALVHMTPSGGWLPEQGYKLYRKVKGQEELLDESAVSPIPGLSGELQVTDADIIQALYQQAELTPEKLGVLGMTAEEFRNKAYRVDSLTPKERIGGKQDFLAMKNALITIPTSLEQKIPETDLLLGSPIYIQSGSPVSIYNISGLKVNLWQKFSLVQAKPPIGIDGIVNLSDGAKKAKLARDIMMARQQICTLAFVDDEFAEKGGFLIRDDLSALNLSNGTKIQYIVESPDGNRSSVTVTYGVENNLTKPQGLMGYGIDGAVSLRWDEAQDKKERSIISGYHIERRFEGETEFSKITGQPIAISHFLNEHDIYFESPVFFEDEVEDGLTAEYRIYAIDVFGRRSEYSDAISVKVERVTPPNAPNIETPALSAKPKPGVYSAQMQGPAANTDTTPGSAVQMPSGVVQMPASVLEDAMKLNNNKPGVVLPIFTDSPDTVRFTIYRAKAVGAESFGPPEILADIPYDNPRPPRPKPKKFIDDDGDGIIDDQPGYMDALDIPVSSLPKLTYAKGKKAKYVLLQEFSPIHPDLVYFDALVQKGCTYKYWVSAWDKWNNESAWSQSVTVGVPTDDEPEIPKAINIAMHLRRLPDIAAAPPGLVSNSVIRYASIPQPGAQAGTADVLELSYAGMNLPDRACPEGAVLGTVEDAMADKAQIGSFLADNRVPKVIDTKYDNLPERRYIHKFVGVWGEDVLPDGIALLRWPAYSGEGLGGYAVYRPLFVPKSLEEMQRMTYSQLVAMGRWKRVGDTITQNQLMVGGLDRTPGKLSLFLVCLEPEEKAQDAPADPADASLSADLPEGGHVYLSWDKPDDPQVAFYRVYRSEVPSFKEPIDESRLEWTLVGDRIEHTHYTQRVEQSFAHYYYYKVTAVSPWGVESKVGRVQRFRVPSTKPPETPNLLVPLSTKDGVKVNFSAVAHCDRYEIWRAPIPMLTMEEIAEMAQTHPDLYEALFGSPDADNEDFLNDFYDMLRKERESAQSQDAPVLFAAASSAGLPFMSMPPSASPVTPSQATSQAMFINPIGKFKTLSFFNMDKVARNLGALSPAKRLAAFNKILDTYGPLALADYSELSWEMSKRVKWEKVGEIPADYNTVEAVDPSTGLLKPLSFTDNTAQYGCLYLYTVQAWNDDNLGSARPEPVIATPRRNRAFDPIDGLQGEIVDGIPNLTWNTPKMPNVSPEKCLEDTVGYIVYRSDTRDGIYYQASPLLFENKWADKEADKNAFNWYKVKVLDTGGYLSEFSEPVLLQQVFDPGMVTVIPQDSISMPDLVVAPKISFGSSGYTVQEGQMFEAVYKLTGTEPITVTVKATDAKGVEVGGFTVITASRKVSASSKLRSGTYTVTVTAKNSAGESRATFTLTVQPREVDPGIPQLPEAVAPVITFDKSSHGVNEGTAFETSYNLSGTEPIAVTLKATDAKGVEVGGFTVNTAARKVSASSKLRAGTYTVTVTAKNSAGESSASFTLTVSAIPQGEPPKLAEREDGYNLKMYVAPFGSKDFTVQFSASGTRPLSWSLEPYKEISVPVEATIDNNGLLTVKSSIRKGTHRFTVKVSNDFGSDTEAVFLEVAPLLQPQTPIIPGLSVIEPMGLLSANTGTAPLSTVNPLLSATNTIPTTTAIPSLELYDYTGDQVRCMGFTLSDVKLNTEFEAYYGTAMLHLGGTPVPVHIMRAEISKQGGVDTMTSGSVFIQQPTKLPGIGLTLVSLDISPHANVATVSGYMKSTAANRNLAGDLYALKFEGAKLYPGAISIVKNLPDIRYKQFKIHSIKEIMIDLGAMQNQGKGLLMLKQPAVTMKFHLETLSNEGLQFESAYSLNFDAQGRLNGHIATETEQCLQLLVPGGAGLRVQKAELDIVDGEIKANGKLTGKLVVPFEKSTTEGDLVPAPYAGAHPAHSEMDYIVSASGALTPAQQEALDSSLVHYGLMVQQNSLLILPKSFALQDKCASVVTNLNNWAGEGFVINAAVMDAVRVTNRNLYGTETVGEIPVSDYLQREQALILSGGGEGYSSTHMTVSVDLNREAALPNANSAQNQSGASDILTPKETEKPFWVGIIFGNGELALPSKYLQQADGKTIRFKLTKGEMLYDLNGFNYQTYLYGSDPAGVPAQFGENLGGFKDVRVQNCLLDLYRNCVNLEIHATVRVDILQNERVEARLYTDNSGVFICSVAPTNVALARGIGMQIDGGFFEKDGMRISGKLHLPAEGFDAISKDPLGFTDLTMPSSLEAVKFGEAAKGTAAVLLDKPVNIDFKGFPMEVREFDLKYNEKPDGAFILEGDTARYDSIRLTMRGATLLADNIALSRGTTDSLVVRCRFAATGASPDEMPDPVILYDQSHSELNTSFDGCIDVTAKRLTPKKLPAGSPTGGLVEFETDGLDLNFLGQSLESLPVATKTRFGKQSDGKFYYVIGMTPLDGQPINFGAGNVDNFTGLVAYNMSVGRDGQGRYQFPDNPGQMGAYIENLPVGGEKFVGGIKGEMSVSGLCTIKNLYFCFEPGPSVTAEGDLYLPLSIESIAKGRPDKFMGKAAISYRHPERYLSFSMTLERINVVLAELGGSLGFEYSPSLFGVYLGYPETLGGSIGIFHVGAGVGFRYDWEKEAGMVQAKMEFGLEKSLDIAIVYLKGYLYAGADGAYYWTPQGDSIALTLYLKGGIEGGVKVGGRRFQVIGFYLDAQGSLASRCPGFDKWDLGCSATVAYSVDVFLFEVEGSVTADFATVIG